MALQTMQKKNLNNPDDVDVHGNIKNRRVQKYTPCGMGFYAVLGEEAFEVELALV